jgi:hypothetical protein
MHIVHALDFQAEWLVQSLVQVLHLPLATLVFEIAIRSKHCTPPAKLAILVILHVSFTKITREVLVGIEMMNIMHIT